jgi:hypothetical protein
MKRSRLRKLVGCLSLASLLLLSIGCETTASSPQPKKLDQAVYIHRGISAANLTQLLGAPASKKSLEATYGETELWIYERTLSTRTALEVTRIQENTYWDPFRGRMVTTEIPFSEPKIIINKEVTEILIVDGIVHDWMRFGDSDTQLAGNSR